jgi:hypothetical protein
LLGKNVNLAGIQGNRKMSALRHIQSTFGNQTAQYLNDQIFGHNLCSKTVHKLSPKMSIFTIITIITIITIPIITTISILTFFTVLNKPSFKPVFTAILKLVLPSLVLFVNHYINPG